MLPVLPFPSTAIRYVVPATAVNVTRLVGTAGLRFSSSLVTTGNKLLTLEPVYTANSVSSGVWKRLVLPSVLNVTGPLLDGVQLYQTEALPAPAWTGSPVSFVAFMFVPIALPDAPVIDSELAKLSFVGAAVGFHVSVKL